MISRPPLPSRGRRARPHRITLAPAVALALAGLVLAGCGNSRPQTPDLMVTNAPDGFRTIAYRSAGLELRAPRDWAVLTHPAPLVATVSSGQAVIALWRYDRPGAYATTDPGQLAHAERLLVTAGRARDPKLQVIRAGAVTVDGRGAVVLGELEHINGRLRRVRSEHIYLNGAEVVLEEYAPVRLFGTVDHLVFSPVRRSLHLLAGPGASG